MVVNILTKLRRKIMERKIVSYEGFTRPLNGSVLVCDAKFCSYLNKLGYDLATLLRNCDFSLAVAVVSKDCPESVKIALSKKIPVVSMPPGIQSFGYAVSYLFGEEIDSGLTVIGRISPRTRRSFTSKGISVFTIEMPESGDDNSCTNIAAGVLDVRDVIGKYPSRRDEI